MKKIKLLATFILMIITMTTFTIVSRATIGIINDDAIKIRREPKATSTVIDLLNEGDEVEVLEQQDGWYKVKAKTELGTITGYIDEKTLDVEENSAEEVDTEQTVEEKIPEQEMPVQENSVQENIEIQENNSYALQKEIKIKALPLIYSKQKAEITGNIKIIEVINDWARVESDIANGWIRKNALKSALARIETLEQDEEKEIETNQNTENEEKKEEIKEPETVELNKVGYVTTDGLMVRKGPSTDTKAIDSLEKNDEVKITGQTGNWYKIDLDGEIGYVSAKYISDTKIPETTSRSGSTLKNETLPEQMNKQEEATKVEEKPSVTEAPAPTPSTSGTTGAAVVEYAKKYLGYKYVSGGASPSKGFDCSGFTTYVYKNFGVSLNRSSKDQIKNGVAVDKNDLQLGDIVIFNNESNTAIGHVGIYVGDGNFIHASNPKDGVKITTLLSGYYKIRYVGARRVI